jgi:hypothetical protein
MKQMRVEGTEINMINVLIIIIKNDNKNLKTSKCKHSPNLKPVSICGVICPYRANNCGLIVMLQFPFLN